MTLNFSPCSILPVNPTENDLVSSIRIANAFVVEGKGNSEKSGDGYSKPKRFNWEIGDSYDICGDEGDMDGSCEAFIDDSHDLLPSDPFDMDLGATFTVIGDWLEEIETESNALEFQNSEVEMMKRDYQLVAGLNFLWNTTMGFQSEPENVPLPVDHRAPAGTFDDRMEGMELCHRSNSGGMVSTSDGDEFLSLPDSEVQEHGFEPAETRENGVKSWESEFIGGVFLPTSIIYEDGDEDDTGVFDFQTEDLGRGIQICSDGDGGAPHEALFFVLGYLSLQDLLSAERVCRSLRSAIQNDTLLWRSIHISEPLSERINDDALLQLTTRSQGNLQCLSLVECPRITDDGLKCVLESNPKLTKLSVPSCTRLSVEGIVNNLKAFNSSGVPGIKQLRIGGLYGVTHKHFEELKLLLGADKCEQPEAGKPQFYHRGHSSLSCNDERAIDIELCPRCHNLRLVYDCPVESCKGKQPAGQGCRACTFCIARCVQCGRCIDDSEYEETFCLDLLCLACLQQMVHCQERLEEKGACSTHTVFHQEARYHFCLYC